MSSPMLEPMELAMKHSASMIGAAIAMTDDQYSRENTIRTIQFAMALARQSNSFLAARLIDSNILTTSPYEFVVEADRCNRELEALMLGEDHVQQDPGPEPDQD